MRLATLLLSALLLPLSLTAQTNEQPNPSEVPTPQVFTIPISDSGVQQSGAQSTRSTLPHVDPTSGQIVVPRDTPVQLRLIQDVNSGDAKIGDVVRWTQVEDLHVDGKVLLPAGTAWTSTVTHVRRKSQSHSGKLAFSEPEIDLTHGDRIRLATMTSAARKEDRQEAAFYLVYGTIVLSPLLAIEVPILAVEGIHHAFHSAAHPTEHTEEDRDEGYRYNGFVRSTVKISPDQISSLTPNAPVANP